MIDCYVKTGPTINHNHKYWQKTSVNEKDVVVVFGMINHNQDHDHLSSANDPATTKKLIYNLHKFDEDTLWLILEWNSSIKLWQDYSKFSKYVSTQPWLDNHLLELGPTNTN